mgnify:CR=1 FL=1
MKAWLCRKLVGRGRTQTFGDERARSCAYIVQTSVEDGLAVMVMAAVEYAGANVRGDLLCPLLR